MFKNKQLRICAKLTICKKCGSKDVGWTQNKAGKWYLVQGAYFAGEEDSKMGYAIFNKTSFHKC